MDIEQERKRVDLLVEKIGDLIQEPEFDGVSAQAVVAGLAHAMVITLRCIPQPSERQRLYGIIERTVRDGIQSMEPGIEDMETPSEKMALVFAQEMEQTVNGLIDKYKVDSKTVLLCFQAIIVGSLSAAHEKDRRWYLDTFAFEAIKRGWTNNKKLRQLVKNMGAAGN